MTTIHKFKWISLSLIALFFIITVIQNTGVTRVQFMAWEFEAPRIAFISGVGLIGFFGGALAVLLIQRNQHHFDQPIVGSPRTDSEVDS